MHNIIIDVLEGLARDYREKALKESVNHAKTEKIINIDKALSNRSAVVTVEDKFDSSFLDDYSMRSNKLHNAEIKMLQDWMDCLQYQNEVNVEWLHSLERKDE